MKRKVITACFIIVCFLLQSTVFSVLQFASIRPNLMIILTSAFGFMRGRKTGMAVGFASGLLMDVCWGGVLGFYTLIFTVIGYLNGSFKRLFFDEDIKLPLGLIAGSELAYGLTVYVCFFMMRGDSRFGHYLIHVVMPELVYTILVTIILYQVILHINRKLEAEEQRSASRFV